MAYLATAGRSVSAAAPTIGAAYHNTLDEVTRLIDVLKAMPRRNPSHGSGRLYLRNHPLHAAL